MATKNINVLNATICFKTVKMATFMLCIVYHTKKDKLIKFLSVGFQTASGCTITGGRHVSGPTFIEWSIYNLQAKEKGDKLGTWEKRQQRTKIFSQY